MRLQLLILSILILALSPSIKAQKSKVFSEAIGSGLVQGSTDHEKWTFAIGSEKFEIRNSGNATRRNSRSRITKFRVRLEKAEILERIYFANYKTDLLLVYESTVGDGGGGHIVRFDGSTLKTKWQRNIPAFNIAVGLIENSSVYVAAIGFVSKINLETGKYIWKHDDLYRKYDESGAFSAFDTPRINGNVIILKEIDLVGKGFDHQLHVNKSSGKIIKVILK